MSKILLANIKGPAGDVTPAVTAAKVAAEAAATAADADRVAAQTAKTAAEAAAAGVPAAVAAGVAGKATVPQVTDAAALTRLDGVAAGDRSYAVGLSRVNYDDADGFTTSWADTTGWTANGVQVSGGKLYALNGASAGGHGAYRSISGLAAGGTVRCVGKIQVAAPGTGAGITLFGVTSAVAGDGSDFSGTNIFALGLLETNLVRRFWAGAAGSAGVTYYGMAAGDALPAGTYFLILNITSTEIAITMHNAAQTIYIRSGVSRAQYTTMAGEPVSAIGLYNSDNRNLTGHAFLPVAARSASVTPKDRTGVEDSVRINHYAVAPRFTRFVTVLTPADFDSRRQPKGVIIYGHGNSDDEDDCLPATQPTAIGPTIKALAEAGYVVVSSDFGGTTNWGNPESMTTMEELYKHLRDSYPLAPIGMIGHSMGGLVTLNTIARRVIPGIVGFYGVEPVCSLLTAYQHATFTPLIKTAFGIASDGSDYAAKTAGLDPMLKEGWAFRGLPMRFIASPTDQYVPKATHTDALVAKLAGYSQDVTVLTASGLHVDPSHFIPSDVVAFFDRVVRGGTN